MLGLAVFHKTFNTIEKKKKVIVSFTLFVLLILSGFMGALFNFKDSNVDALSGTITETYEDDTPSGTHVTDEDWYTFGNRSDGIDPSTVFMTSNAEYHGGTMSYYGFSTDTTNGCRVYLNCSESQNVSSFTLWFNQTSNGKNMVLAFSNSTGSYLQTSNTIRFMLGDGTTPPDLKYHDSTETKQTIVNDYSINEWHNLTITGFNFTDDTFHLYFDSVEMGWFEMRSPADPGNWTTGLMIQKNAFAISHYIDDISLTLGDASGNPTVSLSGLSGGAITFSGTGGVLWCNSTGAGNETMNISITDGASTVTWINVSLFDVTGGGGTLDAEDFYLYASETVDSGFVAISGFPIGGGNVTLNATTWTGGGPFPISTADDVYLRFRLTVDEGEPAGTYNIEAATCKVYIGG